MVDTSAQAVLVRVFAVFLMGLLVLVSVWWDGAFDLRYWAPIALLAVCLLGALLLTGSMRVPTRGPLAVGIAASWAFAAFVLLSAAWSDSPFAAWTEAARTVFYAALWTLAVASCARGAWRERLGGALAIGIAAIAAITLVGLLADGRDMYLAGRLDSPIGYRNATAALFALGVWPLLGFAARRGGSSGLRGLAFAAAVLALGLAFMTQSRGVLVGLILGGAVSLAIGPDRLRRAWAGVAATGLVAAVSGPLLEPYDRFTEGVAVVGSTPIGDAALALSALTGISFVAALMVSVYDNGLRSSSLERQIAGAAVVGLIVVAFGAGAVALAKVGNPVSYAESKVDEFNNVEPAAPTGSTRLGSVGGQRSDLWRVAWDQFADHPLAGAGAGSYQFAYYRDRHTDRNLDDTHSLPLRILADMGLVGALLFLVWMGAIAVAIARRAREVAARERMWLAGLGAAGVTVLAQCLTDWLWLLPGLLGISILALGLAATGEEPDPEPIGGGRWTMGRVAASAGVAAVAISIAFLFLGDLYVRKARVDAFDSPAAELSDARTAAFFNPVSVNPLYLQASALESEGRDAEAKDKLEDAHELEPENFVPLGLLGDFEVRQGNFRVARGYYREALALNPLDIGLKKLSEGAE